MFTLDELQSAAALVHAVMPATPQYAWPLLAGRAPDEDALEAILRGADRIVRVSEDEAAEAMRGGRVGLIVSGGNIDRPRFSEILAGGTPRPATAA